MPWTIEMFKTAFSTKKQTRKMYERRLSKVQEELSGVQLLMERITDRTAARQVNSTMKTIRSQLVSAAKTAKKSYGDAYMALHTTKDDARELREEARRYVATSLPSDGPDTTHQILLADLGRAIGADYRPKHFPLEVLDVELEVELVLPVALYKEIAKNPLIHQKLQDGASEVYKQAVAQGIALVKTYDDTVDSEGISSDAAFEALDDVLGFALRVNDKLKQRVPVGVLRAWEDIKKTKQEYRDYKVKCVVKTTVNVVSIAGGIAGLASSPFTFGIGTVVGIWQLMKGVVELGKGIYDMARSGESTLKSAKEEWGRVQVEYENGSKTSGTLKEGGKKVVSFLVGADFIEGLDHCANTTSLARSKLQGIDIKMILLAAKLPDLLDLMDELEAGMRANGVEHPSLVQAAPALVKVREKLAGMLTKIADTEEMLNDGIAWCESTSDQIEDLQKRKTSEGALFALDIGLTLTDIGLGAAGGIADSIKDSSKILETSLNGFTAVISEVDKRLADKLA